MDSIEVASQKSAELDDAVTSATSSQGVDPPSVTPPGTSNWVEGMSTGQLREEQLCDSNIGIVIYWLEQDYDPSKRELLLTSPETRALWSCRNQLSFPKGVLI